MNHPTQHRARKRFGQHFLHDKTMIGRIIDAIRPLPGEHVVEIGPGLGALTDPLLRTGILLTAVEIDRDLAQRLRDTYAGDERFTLIESDVLRRRWMPSNHDHCDWLATCPTTSRHH